MTLGIVPRSRSFCIDRIGYLRPTAANDQRKLIYYRDDGPILEYDKSDIYVKDGDYAYCGCVS